MKRLVALCCAAVAFVVMVSVFANTARTPTIPKEFAKCVTQATDFLVVAHGLTADECSDHTVKYVRNSYFGFECYSSAEGDVCRATDAERLSLSERICRSSLGVKPNWALTRANVKVWSASICSDEPPAGVPYATISVGYGSNQTCIFPGSMCIPLSELSAAGLGNASLEFTWSTGSALGDQFTKILK